MEDIFTQLMKEAAYAQWSLSRDLLSECFGKAKMAYQLEALNVGEFMEINNQTIYYINTHARELDSGITSFIRADTQPTVCGWIPVSERLPEEPDRAIDQEGYMDVAKMTEYIVTIRDAEESTVLLYAGGGLWVDYDYNRYPVVAWQLWPEVYAATEKGESDAI